MTSPVESHESVLAEMRAHIGDGCACCQSRDFADRLAAAHAREVGAETDAKNAMFIRAREQAELAGKAEARAEAAEGLLREMIELRQATQEGRLTERPELDIVRDAKAHLSGGGE